MKWIFYLIVFAYMLYKAVYAKDTSSVTVDKIDYFRKAPFWKVGTHHSINCKASKKNQKIEWVDPNGKVISRMPSNRVYALEHFTPSPGGRVPASMLHFKSVSMNDNGLYTCRSGIRSDFAEVCVIDPVTFKNPRTEHTADLGRSITLNCHAKGNPEPRIQWKRKDEIINEGEDDTKYKLNTKFSSDGFESSLTVFSLTPEDSGSYSCVAIQENTEQCKHSSYLNITLNVNHAPFFENGNETELVYGKSNQSAVLTCSASGYPTPTYRWFAVNGSTLTEFDKSQIETDLDDGSAILNVVGNQTENFKCEAKNEFGEAEKDFKLVEPSSDSYGGFDIQYLNFIDVHDSPTEDDWDKSGSFSQELPEEENDALKDLGKNFKKLAKVMNYWVRVRVTNSFGAFSWSEPVLIGPAVETEQLKVKEEKEPEDEPEKEEKGEESEEVEGEDSEKAEMNGGGASEATFYGIFFAGGILVVAALCMFIMRRV